MSTIDIILPAAQLEGTSATLSKWLVAIGDEVKKGDPLIELETDKVSMEICAPNAGTLSTIIFAEGEEIAVDTVLGRLDTKLTKIITSTVAVEAKKANQVVNNNPVNQKINNDQTSSDEQNSKVSSDNLSSEQLNIKADFTIDDSAQYLLGPAARRLLKSNHINPNLITGTGHQGRITRNDVRSYLQDTPKSNAALATNTPTSIHAPAARPLKGTMVKHTNMRKAIANHMVKSLLETSPHVTSVFEMDMSNIIEHRKWHKTEYTELGVKLTFTAYFLAAIVKAVKEVPQVNARFHEDELELFSDINIGVGTALGDKGLVVPVVQQVQSMNLFSIAQALSIQTEKARSGNIVPSDMKNGTFTISNHGVSGSLFATPIIINQPEVAILGIGKLEKRVSVEEISGVDTMVIKPKCYVSLSIDHRALDAHQTNLFLSHFVNVIENWGQ
ncbi:MAG: dihydrolipoamide succinyltransferase [Gammaproteobacteria bacterium]|nr:MAG: dihydrolipoamide succinyltransferase [Gammaproteobacteria bacterium]PHR83549.1 MAG: dihydrolipoamide succinyltransferase [Colwellia sp.]